MGPKGHAGRMKFLLAFCLGVALHAQVIVSMTTPGSVTPGKNFIITITAVSPANGADTGISGLEWTLTLPPGGYTAVATVGPAAAQVAKTLSCTADFTTCLVIGMNQTNIPPGVVATYAVHVPRFRPPGTDRIGLSGLVATNGAGTAVPVLVGTSFQVK